MLERIYTPLKNTWDVIVCGGGVSGVAAAVQAARSNAKTLLLEKTVSLGGLATSGLIAWFEPICDGNGQRMMNGMALELFQMAVKKGPHTLPKSWIGFPNKVKDQARCCSFFSPMLFSMALDSWVLDAGVTLALDTLIVRPIVKNGYIKGVITEDKDGRSYHTAKVIIDATGDGDIISRCGLPYEEGRNYLTYISYEVNETTCTHAIKTGNMLYSRRWHTVGANLWGEGHPKGERLYYGISAANVTEFMLKGRARLMEQLCEQPTMKRDITNLPYLPQFRMTRRLKGAFELQETHCGQYFADSIGVAVDFFNRGHIYEMPIRMLYSESLDNLLTAGRTVSSTGWAWEVTRVIPVAIATGQAAGFVAAQMVRNGVGAKQLNVADVQKDLLHAGIRLHIN